MDKKGLAKAPEIFYDVGQLATAKNPIEILLDYTLNYLHIGYSFF